MQIVNKNKFSSWIREVKEKKKTTNKKASKRSTFCLTKEKQKTTSHDEENKANQENDRQKCLNNAEELGSVKRDGGSGCAPPDVAAFIIAN